MVDSATEQDWKLKYFELLDQLEQSERTWREANLMLRRSLSRLALVSHGIDPALDNQLKKLRSALQNRADVDHINEIIKKISSCMKRLDERHEGGAVAQGPAAVLSQVVETVNFPLPLQTQVNQLKTKLAEPDAATNFPPLIDEFAHLVALSFSHDGQGASENEPTAAPLSTRVEQLPLTAVATTGSAVENVFLDILESVIFLPQFSQRVQHLKEQLSKGLSVTSIKSMTESVVTLVVDMCSLLENEKEELERFLQQLTLRLTELDAMVEGAESQRLASLAGGRQFDAIVKAEVGDIEATVQRSTEINQMKRAIQGNLEKIRLHLAEQREQEERRQELLESQLKSLTKKLKHMEDESQQLRKRLVKERANALTDPLTGAPNRLAFDQRIAHEFARWQRYKHPLTLILCDVDHFKRINDTYGHRAGDRALMAIVKTIQFHLRETDFFARIGGEEFAVVLTETTEDDAKTVAEKLRESVENSEFVYQGRPVPITISGGFSEFQMGDTVDTTYQRADTALYRAKHNGRNQFVAA